MIDYEVTELPKLLCF